MKPYRIRCLETTSSTNDDARNAAEAGEGEGLVVHALKQTAGRGRQGRQWESPEGNLYCSILLRPKTETRFFGQYSFVTALALADTVKAFASHVAVTLKWPNDVLANGKKISGILLESNADYLIVGIGINILHHPENVLYPATSLSALGTTEASNAIILETLLDRFWYWYGVVQRQSFGPIRAAWLENAHKGPVTVKLLDKTLQGDFIDIDEEGRLRLRLADGIEKAFTTGDVFFT